MKRGLSYAPLDSIYPSLGLNVLQPSSQADPKTSPRMLNFDIVKGIPSKRFGYQELGEVLSGQVIGLVEFEALNGVKTLLAFTVSRQYKLDATEEPPEWIDITRRDVSTTQPWTGDETNVFDYEIASGLNASGVYDKWIIATNGKDPPIYWDGTAARFKTYKPDIAGFQTCQTIRMFYNHLVLANVTTSSRFGQQVEWSDTQSLVNFTGENAGGALIPEVQGSFQKAEHLGDRLALYGDNSVTTMIYVGGTQIFSFEQTMQETRLVSPRSIVNLGPFHVFLSQENVYLFDGSRLTRTMGDRIFREYREDIAVPRQYEAFAFHDSPRQHVYFVIPTGEHGHRIYKMEYDLYDIGSSKWVAQELAERPSAMGYFSRINTVTWDSAVATDTAWEDARFAWGSASVKKGFPVRVIGFDGQVVLADDTQSLDNASVVTGFVDSVDFTVPQGHLSETARWLEIEIEASGTEMDVLISIDMGETYKFIDTIVVQGGWRKYSIPIDVISNRIRVRILNAEGNGALSYRSLKIWYRPGGPE